MNTKTGQLLSILLFLTLLLLWSGSILGAESVPQGADEDRDARAQTIQRAADATAEAAGEAARALRAAAKPNLEIRLVARKSARTVAAR